MKGRRIASITVGIIVLVWWADWGFREIDSRKIYENDPGRYHWRFARARWAFAADEMLFWKGNGHDNRDNKSLLLSSYAQILPATAVLTAAQAPAPTPTSTTGTAGQLDIPLRTWIARAYTTPNAPGAGGNGRGGGSKHLRLAPNPRNGRIYFEGGDYGSNPGDGSFENGLWSYDVVKDQWIMDYPYCGYPGDIMPGRPDEVGWVWDSKR